MDRVAQQAGLGLVCSTQLAGPKSRRAETCQILVVAKMKLITHFHWKFSGLL
jgi:hypothetical protein